MPTYQYACTECDHAFDQVQSFSDDALTECPQCQGRLRKLFNAVGVVFKGSGFYRTDSRAGESSEKSTETSTEKTTEKTSEKTPEKTGTSEKSSGAEKSPAAASSSSTTAAAS